MTTPNNIVDFKLAQLLAEITGGGGTYSVPLWFPDTDARDEFYTDNPDILVQGILCGVGNPIQGYQYDGAAWETVDLLFAFQGAKGDEGKPGNNPASGTTSDTLTIVRGNNTDIDVGNITMTVGVADVGALIWDDTGTMGVISAFEAPVARVTTMALAGGGGGGGGDVNISSFYETGLGWEVAVSPTDKFSHEDKQVWQTF